MQPIAPLQDSPEAHNIRVRDTLLVVIKGFYFIHLTVSCLYSAILLIFDDRITNKFTFTLLLICLYGFILVWLIIFNFFCVVNILLIQLLNKDIWAVWCNRFIAKIMIMIFPIFAIFSGLNEKFLGLRSIRMFMVYNCLISLAMIIYEIYSCTWGHHEEPNFLYHPNDLQLHSNEVWNKRKEYQAKKKFRETGNSFKNTGFSTS